MKLFVLILNRTEKLDDLMAAYAHAAICGATIIDSTGMARELYGAKHDEEGDIVLRLDPQIPHGRYEKDEQDRPYRHKGGSA